MSRRYSSVVFSTIRRKVFRNMADNRKQIPWPWQLSRRASGRRVVVGLAGRKDRSFGRSFTARFVMRGPFATDWVVMAVSMRLRWCGGIRFRDSREVP
jgi:hypothetical protein